MRTLFRIATFSFSFGLLLIPLSLHAQFPNPIAAPTIQALVEVLLQGIVAIATPFVVLFLMYSGWTFVTANGNEEKLKKAKETFFWTLVGGVVLLGAWAISQAIAGTVRALGA